MKWAMSHDYAAIMTTAILAVLAVGTVQTYTLMKIASDFVTEGTQLAAESWQRCLDAVRQGQAPADEDLDKAYSRRFFSYYLAFKPMAAYAAGFLWSVIVTVLGTLQVKILRWAATEDPGKEPGLARTAFYCVTAAIILLLAEGLIRVFARLVTGYWKAVTPIWRQSSRSERAEMDRALREYWRTGQWTAPMVATPPDAPGEGTPANPPDPS